MSKHLRRLAFVFFALPTVAAAQADSLDAQRRLFEDAYRKIGDGKPVDIGKVSGQLGDYALTPYLRYAALKRDLAKAPAGEVARFLDANGDLGVAQPLRLEYLALLASQQRWDDFMSLYRQGTGAEMSCLHLRGLASQGKIDDGWVASGRELWRSSRDLPAACDSVLASLVKSGELREADVWARTTDAMEAGETRLAGRYKALLSAAHRAGLEQWLAVSARPTLLQSSSLKLIDETAYLTISQGLRRLAREKPDDALALAERLADKVSEEQAVAIKRDIAVRAAWSQHPQALAWLDALPAAAVNDDVLQWRARLLLIAQDWDRLLPAIAALPESMRADSQWRYWRAFALYSTGKPEEAKPLYQALAQERHYYGFLAADQLNLPYNLNQVPTRFKDEDLKVIAAEPGIRRAEEFHKLGLKPEARREWQTALSRMNTDQQAKAAALALSWGWYDRAIMTANQAGLDDALELRFPTPYRDAVERASHKHRLDPSLTYAILRKESAFRADAVSPVGALGLMQVMPATGRQIAREMKVKAPGRAGLLDPSTNLNFGSYYLKSMMDKYRGNLAMAAAAYNAGPQRVAQWVARNPDVMPTVWVEAISFSETRDYVKSVLAFRAVFDWQLTGGTGRLADYMQPIDRDFACRLSKATGGCGKD